MKILVTGAAGFIGTHLVKRLWDDGHMVTKLDVAMMGISTSLGRGGHMVVVCPPTDIRDEKAMRQCWETSSGSFDACVHLAALASPWKCQLDHQTSWSTNVMGTYNVLSLCKRLGVRRVVFPSSAHVYGVGPKYLPTDEEHPLALLDTYTTTKVMGERLCEQFHRYHGLSYAALRLFNAYGPGQSDEYFLGATLKRAQAGGPVTLREGGTTTTKDWVHVSDVVEAMVRALSSDYVGSINVGTGIETSLEEIAHLVAGAFGVGVAVEGVAEGGPTRMCADIARAKAVLGWEPKVRFKDGLNALIAEVRK